MDDITRRKFLGKSITLGTGLASLPLILTPNINCAARKTKDDISLAAWSLVREFRQGKWKNLDLPRICREDFDINGIEFVNNFFEVPTYRYLQQLKRNADNYGVQLVLIMVDSEGEMAASSKSERMQTVVNHRKWIDIAHYLGCHSIRTNCRGPKEASREDVLNWAEESFNNLLEYAKQAQINVIIENHGGLSSDPDFLVSLMKHVNDPNLGTLPDFGNFPDNIDRAEAIKKLIPYARGVSVKSYFTTDHTHPAYDLEALINLCHNEGYRGFYGIEAEGKELDSWAQVKLTKKAIERALLEK